ncbi:unnamed protein product [Caenorhabditis brenneri]
MDHLHSLHVDAERSQNVFTPFYRNPPIRKKKPNEALTSVQRDLRSYTHNDALDFAAASLSWKNSTGDHLRALPRLDHKMRHLTMQDGIRAYYRVIAEKSDSYILSACHVNIHGHHRGDLRFIEVNDRTETFGLDDCSLIGKLYLGDVLAVTGMARLRKFEDFDVFKSSEDANCIWMATNVRVIPRTILRGVTFSVLENQTAVVKEQNEVMNVKMGSTLQPDKLYTGDAFLPEPFTQFFTREHRDEHKNSLIAKCSKINQYPNPLGTIFHFEDSYELSRIFDVGLEAFSPGAHYYSPETVIETCVLMGYAAAISISNGRFDARPFPMYGTERNKLVVKFSIDNPPDNPTYGKWTINSRIRITGPPAKDDHSRNTEINAVIETVIIDQKSKQLKITARLARDIPKSIKFDNGVHIVCQREALEAQVLKKGFFSETPVGSNGRRIIEALYGGTPISSKPIYYESQYYYPVDPVKIMLNKYQCEYVDMLRGKNPIVVGSSPFGCGKSMTIITAALNIFKTNLAQHNLQPYTVKKQKQLLVTQSNYASVNLVEIAQKLTEPIKFVRYVSEKNWKELPEDCLTQSDLPRLMKTEFILWAFGRSESNKLEKKHTTNMISFLLAETNVEPKDFAGQAFKAYNSGFKKKVPWFYDLMEAFFILYDPDIIMTTSDSLQGLMNAEFFKSIPISTIQIDEASQVPEYTLIGLLTSFPKACFGLIGDIQQLPPYCETGLEGKLKDYGIGNTMERAVEGQLFPQAMLREVYRCHPKTTGLLSELFYDGKLISGVQEHTRTQFMRSRPDFWPSLDFPVMIVNNRARGQKMGTSYSNKHEKDIVKQIIDSLDKPYNNYKLPASDIGVISFYSAQTSILTEALRGRKVKCGTVDAFQGSEKEVIVLCCTNERISEFMQLGNRLNVAMSRAKQATIIVGNLDGLKKAKYWGRIVQEVMENGCAIEADRIGKLQLTRTQPRNRSRSNRNRRNQAGPSSIPAVPEPTAPPQVAQEAQPVDELAEQTQPISAKDLVANLRLQKELEDAKKTVEAMKAEKEKMKTEMEKVQEKEWNICEICLLPYEQGVVERTPKILDCGHTFCQECAGRMARNGSIFCGLCRATTHSSADKLKTNFAIYKHV